MKVERYIPEEEEGDVIERVWGFTGLEGLIRLFMGRERTRERCRLCGLRRVVSDGPLCALCLEYQAENVRQLMLSDLIFGERDSDS